MPAGSKLLIIMEVWEKALVLCTRFYWKVPGLGQKREAGLTYSILAAISFKIVSLGMYTAIP
jgi:hypothetical protein